MSEERVWQGADGQSKPLIEMRERIEKQSRMYSIRGCLVAGDWVSMTIRTLQTKGDRLTDQQTDTVTSMLRCPLRKSTCDRGDTKVKEERKRKKKKKDK